jgi:CubicO group peptidase (beta-lactamase class C family)
MWLQTEKGYASAFKRCPAYVCIASLFILSLPVANSGVRGSGRLTRTRDNFPVPTLMIQGEVPGLAIAIVRNDRVVFLAGYGKKNTTTGDPVRRDTVFEAASLSKPVVAYVVLKLVDQQKVSLDAPVSRYIRTSELQSDPRWNRITVRMLLDHTSGLPNELQPGETLQIAFDPGTRFSYSGIGYSYLQQIIETVSGEPFESYIEQVVFGPLQMASSSFVWRPDYESRKASGHDSTQQPTKIRRPLVPKAPSSLHTTAADYARFLIAVLNGTGLRPETKQAMLTMQHFVQSDCVVCTNKPLTNESSSVGWGLGWAVERSARDEHFFHWGENNGDFQAFVEGDVRSKSGVVILTNSGNGLSIVPAIVKSLRPTKHLEFTWMGYETFDSPARTKLRQILKVGAEAVLPEDFRRTQSSLTETQWNRIGYQLLARRRIKDAIAVFEYNSRMFPNSANVFDSLGEAYMVAGDRDAALRNYEKSLALDPHNTNARRMIEKLR